MQFIKCSFWSLGLLLPIFLLIVLILGLPALLGALILALLAVIGVIRFRQSLFRLLFNLPVAAPQGEFAAIDRLFKQLAFDLDRLVPTLYWTEHPLIAARMIGNAVVINRAFFAGLSPLAQQELLIRLLAMHDRGDVLFGEYVHLTTLLLLRGWGRVRRLLLRLRVPWWRDLVQTLTLLIDCACGMAIGYWTRPFQGQRAFRRAQAYARYNSLGPAAAEEVERHLQQWRESLCTHWVQRLLVDLFPNHYLWMAVDYLEMEKEVR